MKKLIEIRDLNKKYGLKNVLKDISISLYDGEIYGLVGPNGAGKSTIFKILAGYTYKTSGEITILGESEKLDKVRPEIGFLIESPIFYDYMTGEQNLKYLCKLKDIKYDDEIIKITKELGIYEQLKVKVKNYSVGMRQRLGIVVAVMSRPKILVLDEPINGIDPEGIVEIRNLFLRINREWNTSIIISSHILGELSMIATKIGFLKEGKLVKEVNMKDIRNENLECILIVFSDEILDKAIAILESSVGVENYKVKNDGKVEIYDKIEQEKIQKKLAEYNIFPKSINKKTGNLEEYYMNIMEEYNV